jgi:hypothetical protein
MLSGFVPADHVSSYQLSPYKSRIDRLGAHLIEQRYVRAAIAQHVREWLRFTAYLETHGATLPPTREALHRSMQLWICCRAVDDHARVADNCSHLAVPEPVRRTGRPA